MKTKIRELMEIPEGVQCTYEKKLFTCRKGEVELQKIINIPKTQVKIENNNILFLSNTANKVEKKKISTFLAHLRNMFSGLEEKFVYQLESANVHFPMTLKLEGDKLKISNFLGEKISRVAQVLPNVEVEIKGNEITISSHNKESAGQTAANFEKATKVKGRDRRIFQDGIFITHKPGDKSRD